MSGVSTYESSSSSSLIGDSSTVTEVITIAELFTPRRCSVHPDHDPFLALRVDHPATGHGRDTRRHTSRSQSHRPRNHRRHDRIPPERPFLIDRIPPSRWNRDRHRDWCPLVPSASAALAMLVSEKPPAPFSSSYSTSRVASSTRCSGRSPTSGSRCRASITVRTAGLHSWLASLPQ